MTTGTSKGAARLRRSPVIGLVCAFGLAGVLLSPANSAAQTLQKWHGSLDAIGQGGSVNDGQLDLFQPLFQNNDTLFFGNAIGAFDSDSSSGANFGAGIRHIFDGSYILGAYGYFDWLHSPNANTFYQVSGGVEAMTPDWDFRLNGYLPVSGSADLVNIPKIDGVEGMLGDPTVAIQGNEIGLLRQGIAGMPGQDGLLIQERPLGGIEGEVGYRLPFGNTFGDNTETRVFLGGYAFWGDGYPTYAGPRGRIEFRLYDLPWLGDGSRLTAGGEIAWDDPRGVQGEGSLRLRLPFNFLSGGAHQQLSDLDRRMVDPIPIRVLPVYGEREQIDIAKPGGPAPMDTFEAVADNETGREISSIYFASASGTGANSGEQGNATDLTDAISRAGMNGLIVATGSGGSYTGHFGLFEGQILLGGASSLDVKGVTSGAVITYTPGLTRPTIIHDGTMNVGAVQAYLVNNAKMMGFDVTVNNKTSDPSMFHYFGVLVEDSSNDIVRDVKVTGGDGAFGVGSFNAPTTNTLFNNISATASSVGLFAFDQTAGPAANKVSNLKINGANFDSLIEGSMSGVGFRTSVLMGQSIDNMEVDNATVTNTRWGALFMRVNGLTVDGWTGAGDGTNLADNTAMAVQNGSDFTLRNFSASDYLSGISLLNNGANNLIDGSTRGIIKDIGTQATSLQGSYGIEVSATAAAIQNVSISGIGSTGSNQDFAVILAHGADVKLSNVAIDGKNSNGDLVTETAVLLSGNGAADSITLESGSDNNTAINVPELCRNVLTGGATATGTINFTNPAASTCP